MKIIMEGNFPKAKFKIKSPKINRGTLTKLSEILRKLTAESYC